MKALAKTGGGEEEDRERSYSSSSGGWTRKEKVTSFRQRQRKSKTKGEEEKEGEKCCRSNIRGRKRKQDQRPWKKMAEAEDRFRVCLGPCIVAIFAVDVLPSSFVFIPKADHAENADNYRPLGLPNICDHLNRAA